MRFLTSMLLVVSAANAWAANAKDKQNMTKEMKILKPESLPSNPGPTDTFTGSVRVTPLIQGEEPSCLTCASVGFQPGARSAWHTHPKGQLLVVTDGAGLIQESLNGKVVDWMDKVTDDEYKATPQ
jgi:hypothetical protein